MVSQSTGLVTDILPALVEFYGWNRRVILTESSMQNPKIWIRNSMIQMYLFYRIRSRGERALSCHESRVLI